MSSSQSMRVGAEWICDEGCGRVDARGGIDMTARCMNCNATCTRYIRVDDVELLLAEVSRDFAGAHVNAGVVVGAVRKALRNA